MWQKVHKLRGTICREEDIFSLVDRNVSSRKKTSLQTFSERLHFCWENYGKSAHAAVAKLISILIKQTGGGRMPTNSSRKRRCLHIVKLFSLLPPSSQKHAAAASAFCLSSKKKSLFAMRVFNFASPPQLCFPHGKKYNILRLRCGTPTNICRENLPLPEKEGRGAPACLKGDPPPPTAVQK